MEKAKSTITIFFLKIGIYRRCKWHKHVIYYEYCKQSIDITYLLTCLLTYLVRHIGQRDWL